MHAVIANLLQTRKQRVSLVTMEPGSQKPVVQVVERTATDPPIEFLLTAELVKHHEQMLQSRGNGR